MTNTKQQYLEELKRFLDKQDSFNIFKVLKLQNYELRHSNFLAWLLNPNENHGLNEKFLKAFIDCYNNTTSNGDKIKCENSFKSIEIKREFQNIDIFIMDNDNKNIIVIENKINSSQHDDQLINYEKKVEKLDEVTQKGYNVFYIYLKPIDNEQIGNWIFISYNQILHILKNLLNNNYLSIDTQIKSIIEQYTQILEEQENSTLRELCLAYQEVAENEIDEELKVIVDNQLAIRRWEIINLLKNYFSANGYKIVSSRVFQFKIEKDNKLFEISNIGTKNNSEIKVIACEDWTKTVIDETNYNKIFYASTDNLQNIAENYFKLILNTID